MFRILLRATPILIIAVILSFFLAVPVSAQGGGILFGVPTGYSNNLTAGECTFIIWHVTAYWKTITFTPSGFGYPQSNASGDTSSIDGRQQVCPRTTTTYTIRAVFKDGAVVTKSTTITVSVPPPQQANQLNFTADQTTVNPGQCTTLRWHTVNAVYLNYNNEEAYELVPGFDNPRLSDGTIKVCPTTTTTYTVYVTFRGGSSQNKFVTIKTSAPPPPPPTSPSISFYADPPTVVLPNCSTLRWDVENASAVYWGSEQVGFHDSRQVCPTTGTAYQLVVTPYSGENVLKLVTVNVRQPSPAPPVQQQVPPPPPPPPPVQQPEQPVYVQPNTQPNVQTAPQNPSNVSTSQENNPTLVDSLKGNINPGVVFVASGFFLFLAKIINLILNRK